VRFRTIPPVISFPVVFRLRDVCLFQYPLPTADFSFPYGLHTIIRWTTLGLSSLTSVICERVRCSLYAGR